MPTAVKALTHTFAYNDMDSLMTALGNETAAVILEPMTFDFPQNNFLHEVRKACDANGTLLIFDEMWTGFRWAVGGARVTGVCGTPRLAFVQALGADAVIDYTKEDFTQNGETYDLILDVLGKRSFARCKNSLKSGGVYLLASFKMKAVWQMLWTSVAGDKKVICALVGDSAADLAVIKEMAEAGKIKGLVDRCFPLEQTAAAHRYVETGRKRGNVVILMNDITIS